jgi:hypothetical protein
VPYFSVIIPTFNREGLIGQTLRSVFSQEYLDYEVIVVDDGSTDRTVDVVKSLGQPLRLLVQDNSGPGAARNLGVEHARGDYIAFLDSDDVWYPWTLAGYKSVIEKHFRPAVVVGKPRLFEASGEAVAASEQSEPVAALAFDDYLASGDQWRWWGVSSFVIRRDAIQQTRGFLSDRVNGEDADLMLQLGTAPGFVQVTSPATFAYRCHGGNVMSNLDKTLAGARKMLSREHTGAYPGGTDRSWERRRIITRHVRPVSLDLLSRGRRSEAWELYRSTFGWHVREHRWRYMLAFPALAARSRWRANRVQMGAAYRPAA